MRDIFSLVHAPNDRIFLPYAEALERMEHVKKKLCFIAIFSYTILRGPRHLLRPHIFWISLVEGSNDFFCDTVLIRKMWGSTTRTETIQVSASEIDIVSGPFVRQLSKNCGPLFISGWRTTWYMLTPLILFRILLEWLKKKMY